MHDLGCRPQGRAPLENYVSRCVVVLRHLWGLRKDHHVAFWSCWLVAGPWFVDMAWFLGKVASITTDGGVEHLTVEMPNVLKAFCLWTTGRPMLDCA